MSNTSSLNKSSVNRFKCDGYEIHLAELRLAKGWTQSDFARELGKTPAFVNMIERGKLIPILETRIKIAQALGTDTSAVWVKVDEHE